jgi:hypothetical protein
MVSRRLVYGAGWEFVAGQRSVLLCRVERHLFESSSFRDRGMGKVLVLGNWCQSADDRGNKNFLKEKL